MLGMKHFIETHQQVAFIVSAAHLTLAHILNYMTVPTIVMQLVQISAWCTTITVGLISIYGTYKRWKHGKKK